MDTVLYRIRRVLATMILAAAFIMLPPPFEASATVAETARPARPIAAPSSVRSVADAAGPVLISGLDLHDVTIKKFNGVYYAYGSMYACGFEWYIPNTPWCGFGVSNAASLSGPWSAPKLLFGVNSTDPSEGVSWQVTCGGTGAGCFNPRMIRRSGWGANDGVYILWFNAPRQYADGAPHAYNVMGCAGPEGPCGPGAQPHGSYNKPVLTACSGANGDFGMVEREGYYPALVCSAAGASQLNLEQLNYSGSGGTSNGVKKVAGMNGPVEGPGGWWDADSGRYVLTFSDQGCGYCAGTPAGYATSASLYSGWTAQNNVGWGAPDYSRRLFSTASCGGQPRTVSVLDGQPWQIIDLWLGTRNETNADTYLVPLSYIQSTGVPGDGKVWRPEVAMTC